MNNVNSISQMNSVACEHSSLIGHEAGKRPASAMMPGEKGPEGKHMFLWKAIFFFFKIHQKVMLSIQRDLMHFAVKIQIKLTTSFSVINSSNSNDTALKT